MNDVHGGSARRAVSTLIFRTCHFSGCNNLLEKFAAAEFDRIRDVRSLQRARI